MVDFNRWPLKGGVKNKYKKDLKDLVKKIGDEVRVLEIQLETSSKVKNQWIYSCKWVKNGAVHNTNIMAHDVTEALFKLDKLHPFGMSDSLMNHVLTSESFSENWANFQQAKIEKES